MLVLIIHLNSPVKNNPGINNLLQFTEKDDEVADMLKFDDLEILFTA